MSDRNPSSFGTWALELGLYRSTVIDDWEWVNHLEHVVPTFNAWCVDCGRESVFGDTYRPLPYSMACGRARPDLKSQMRPLTMHKTFACAKDDHHKIHLMFRIDDEHITKIGQYPSRSDLAKVKLKRHQKVLDKQSAHELAKAHGLFSHGVGVGSFVYLRRILERLIAQAELRAKAAGDLSEPSDTNLRVSERIGRLRGHLPDFLVDHKQIYGVLSKGIHELTEEDCMGHFQVVAGVIDMILDELAAHREQEARKKRLKTELQKLGHDLGK